jgi:ABC-2 type transport system ATP-binding protein
MSISITNLSKTYGTQKAVNNISFNVAKGEIVGFLGPNGAGKSTTMKMITGYLDADAGSINVSGINVSKENIESKKKIGYLPEANPLYFEMYVREYLHFVAGVHQIKNAAERTEEIIKTVVLILDEPTSGLDPNQIIEIRNVIKALSKDKTVLFSSHILQEVEAICDRVIIINKGNIVADDSLQNLQKNNRQQQFVSVSFQEEVNKNLLENLSASGTISSSANTFRIQTTDAETLRKQLLQLSIDNNLNIVSLQNENNSLEDIFRTLTNNT